MKPFRFAWNARILSKAETWTILGTIIATLVPLLIVIFTALFLKLAQKGLL